MFNCSNYIRYLTLSTYDYKIKKNIRAEKREGIRTGILLEIVDI